MAAVSSRSDLLHLEADAIQTQSELLLDVANEIHFAASILQLKTYDLDSRTATLRKAAWNATRSTDGKGMVVDSPNKEEECRVLNLLTSGTQMVKAAEQVKIWLMDLVDATRGDGAIESGIAAMDWEKEEVKIRSEDSSVETDNITRLSDMSAEQLIDTAPTNVNTASFVPVNFCADLCLQPPGGIGFSMTDYRLPKIDFPANKSTRFRLSGGEGKEFGRYTSVEPDEEASNMDVDSQLQEEKGVLDWIPSNVDVKRISVPEDNGLQALMMEELGRTRRERTS